ncbi:hypothetical protein ACOSQ3_018255 [Xanthoceras sorbifolium]
MESKILAILIKLLLIQYLSVLCVSQNFDFFYFVQQWPGSYCDTAKSCCYPTTGKPEADFGIHGLWPNYKDGSYPSNCDPDSPFDQSRISDLRSRMQKDWPTLACPSGNGITFWSHEWEKHGTCSESSLDQHAYFQTALNIKKQVNLLQILQTQVTNNLYMHLTNHQLYICVLYIEHYFLNNLCYVKNVTGINPDGGSYSLETIKDAIKEGSGYTPWIECNRDESGNSQLYQIYLCVDTSGSKLIECPVFPKGKCGSEIEFPSF